MSASAEGMLPLAGSDRSTAPRFSGTTRYLAAAAHTDAEFRQAVLNHIHHGEFRCKAPEFGVDENVIIEQCRSAARRRKLRDASLLAVVLVFAITSQSVGELSYVLDEPELLGEYVNLYLPDFALLLLAGVAILFGERLIFEHLTLRKRFARSPVESAKHPAPDMAKPRQNLVVYGGYSPFVGSGLTLRDWSFAINLQKTAEGGDSHDKHDDVSVAGLIDAIRTRLDHLAIPGLDHYHVLFADGRYVREDARLMSSPYKLPPRHIPEPLVMECGTDDETCRRTYLCIAVTDWSGEMVLTSYLRIKRGKSHLFAEASHFILPPLKQRYYDLNSMNPMLRLKHLTRWILSAVVTAPFALALSPFFVLAALNEPLLHWRIARQTRKEIRNNPMFNFGALTSIRQIGAENRFRVYFQQLDRDMHRKTTEQCVIDAIVDYLEQHGVDTSDIRERRTAILNTGVMISGGVVNAQSVVAGTGAKSIISRVQPIKSAMNNA